MGSDHVHFGQARLHARNAASLGRKQETDTGQHPGLTKAEQERIKALEWEDRELRKANETLCLASAFLAQAELDRRFKS